MNDFFKNRIHCLFLFLLLLTGCVVQYIPETNEFKDLLVVEGLITDQPGINTIRLSKTDPIWAPNLTKPLKGCVVSISDDLGNTDDLTEISTGVYVTDASAFQGIVGREYTLHIRTTLEPVNYSYISLPMKMNPVPTIDSIYYEKKTYQLWPQSVEGCQIYLNTFDPADKCKFYRWDFSETWEFHLPFDVPKRVCWQSSSSNQIFIKSTSALNEGRIERFPINTIKNPVDKLSVKYSILVNQFSLNDNEYLYWERLKTALEQVGGLYDQVPTSIPNNIYCVEEPDRKVLGYFSVSAKSSRRFFIKDTFAGFDGGSLTCITDTIPGTDPIPGINSIVWILIDDSDKIPPKRYITNKHECADCRTRGTDIKPDFWIDGK
jgi:hypothetical protein